MHKFSVKAAAEQVSIKLTWWRSWRALKMRSKAGRKQNGLRHLRIDTAAENLYIRSQLEHIPEPFA